MSRKNKDPLNRLAESSSDEDSDEESSSSEEETPQTKKKSKVVKKTKKSKESSSSGSSSDEESSSSDDEPKNKKKGVKFAKGTKKAAESSSESSSDEDSDEESSSSEEEAAPKKKRVVKKVVVKKPGIRKVVKKVIVKKKATAQSPYDIAGITINKEQLAALRKRRFLVKPRKEGPEVELSRSSKDEKKNQTASNSPIKVTNREKSSTESGCTSSFALPKVARERWGPDLDEKHVATNFSGIPFAAFSRGDRIGRIADFTASARNPRQMRGFGANISGLPDTFAYKQEMDENSFKLVDRGPQKKKHNRYTPRQKWTPRNPRSNFNRNRSRRPRWNNRNNRGRWNQRQPIDKDPSVKIEDSWDLIGEIEFGDLPSSGKVVEGEDIAVCGSVKRYSQLYDRILPKTAVPLSGKKDISHITASTSADPVLKKLMKDKTGTVYATDTILGALMACKCSRLSWDLIIKKTKDGELILDKRPNSKLDYVTVNENWADPPQASEGDNSPSQLSKEATYVSRTYSQQCLEKGTDHQLGKHTNPFVGKAGESALASEAYRYRSFEINEDTKVVTRTTVNAYLPTKGEGTQVTNVGVRALNQSDPKRSGNVDWTKKLDTQAGSILATELKNNYNKITRWIAEMTLAECKEIRIGFVSRKHPTNADQHMVLFCKRYHSLVSFSTAARVRASSLWATLEGILVRLQELSEGTYLLMRDPVDPKFSIYEVPPDAFKDESGDPWSTAAEATKADA